MNDLSKEIDNAKVDILDSIPDYTWKPSIPDICDDLGGDLHREDALRMAVWALIQEGKLTLTKDWKLELIK